MKNIFITMLSLMAMTIGFNVFADMDEEEKPTEEKPLEPNVPKMPAPMPKPEDEQISKNELLLDEAINHLLYGEFNGKTKKADDKDGKDDVAKPEPEDDEKPSDDGGKMPPEKSNRIYFDEDGGDYALLRVYNKAEKDDVAKPESEDDETPAEDDKSKSPSDQSNRLSLDEDGGDYMLIRLYNKAEKAADDDEFIEEQPAKEEPKKEPIEQDVERS